jgi:serine/threonine-protein kinase HipA
MPELSDTDEPGNVDPLLKFSLAGVQLKFSVAGNERGLTVPARGRAGNIILKFPDGRSGFSGVPEAELGSLELAAQSGIDSVRGFLVAPDTVSGLEEYSAGVEERALAVHRFDRSADDRRIHMEEIAQVLNISAGRGDAKYSAANFETVATVVAALTGTETVSDVIDRIVLNVLIGNGDAHLKNWAVRYPDGRTPELSPAYDLVPTVLYIPGDNLGLNLAGSKKFAEVTPRSFESLGRRTGYGPERARKHAVDSVQRVMDHIGVLHEYLPEQGRERLRAHHARLGLLSATPQV